MSRPQRARLGMEGHARILARLRHGGTYEDLVGEKLVSSHVNGHRFLASMHKLLRIHISDWREEQGRKLRPVWMYGYGDDMPVPTHRAGKKRRVVGVHIPTVDLLLPSFLALDMLMDELEQPRTQAGLEEATGLDFRTVRAALRGLRPLLREIKTPHGPTLWQLHECSPSRHSKLMTGPAAFRSASSIFTLGD